MKVGYARVSTLDQNLDLQTDALQKEGCKEIFEDHASGAKADRDGLRKALEFMREGDTLVVWKLDRLGRSLKHLIDVINRLNDNKMYFKSVQESIDTASSGGKLIFTQSRSYWVIRVSRQPKGIMSTFSMKTTTSR